MDRGKTAPGMVMVLVCGRSIAQMTPKTVMSILRTTKKGIST
jgi:hypothetical protein